MEQRVITSERDYRDLDAWFETNGSRGVMLVSDPSIAFQTKLLRQLEAVRARGIRLVSFSDFQPNPLYESAVRGVELWRSEGCGAIMAVGGGSAMDVAKCIKLYCNMAGSGENGDYLRQEAVPNDIPFLAMPTTAGTGSEATRYAVLYYEGKKQSITSESMIPGTVLMDPDSLVTLPLYQKKATMMDAFCHAMEAFWSVNSTEESRAYSRTALQTIMRYMDAYLGNTEEGRLQMLRAANTAGKAINITQTTAGHAMCYKITSLFGVSHGHAAALCDRILFPWMIRHTSLCVDPRGEGYLKGILDELGQAMGCKNAAEGAEKLRDLFSQLELSVPEATQAQFEELKTSVNPVRLKNHPVSLSEETIDELYHQILR